ncbi:hypothetical protein BDU57DRAFT_511861 [Ampelomyces quisqualis]|uniref:SMP domain-containing protein n=1 Tax=Ampelomyces quisqualis TaxID=50730 RepID=A0A6A5QTL4_AMPQU|nr:hypothetical protein BDU57DRAFT_511861 [Ampelomyces quisqualis]
MSSKLLRFTRFAPSSRLTSPTSIAATSAFRQNTRAFTNSSILAVKVDSSFISQITAAEKTITNKDEPEKGGPTAAAQSHVGQELTSQVVHDITMGERKITGNDRPVQNGPTSVAQSILTSGRGASTNTTSSNSTSTNASNAQHNGRLDSDTIGRITEKEKQITGEEGPVKGGPTAQAQKHANQPITSEALHDITEGEKKITGGERIKGGPTSAAQSELGKSRS